MAMKISVGSDPEFVIMENGEPISAPRALNHPNSLTVKKAQTRFGGIYPDNANLEFSPNPGKTKNEFVKNLRGILGIANKLIGEGRTLHSIPSLEYPQKELEHPLCKKFGCEPSYSAYTIGVNEIPSGAVGRRFRTAGGHVHVGSVDESDFLHDFDGKINTVKTFELIAGIPALFMDNSEAALKRRSLYGSPGDHRPKSYGVECRSLSNFWMQTPQLAEFVWDATQTIVTEMQEKNVKIDLDSIQPIIQSADFDSAKPILHAVMNHYPKFRDSYEAAFPDSQLDKTIPLHETWNL